MKGETAILLAVRNGGRFLGEQLDSLLAQTVQDFTIWAHDDGSEDDSLSILQAYAARHPGRLRILEGPPAGSAKANFLYLLRQVRADWYFFCDQDDIWLPGKVEKSRLAMEKMADRYGASVPLAVFGDMQIADAEGNMRHPSYLQYMGRDHRRLSVRQLLVQNKAAGCTMLINRALAEKALQVSDEDNIVMHDWWLMLTAAACGHIGYIAAPLLLYRQHGSNQIGTGKSHAAWLAEKTGNLLTGRQLQSSRKGILEQRQMALELSRLLPADHPDRAFLCRLADIGECPRRERIRFYRQNHLLPEGARSRWKILIV